MDRDLRRGGPFHQGDLVDALLARVVTHVHFVGVLVIYGLAAHGGREVTRSS
jgi:hypothetical protein